MRKIKFRFWNKKDNAMIQASEYFDSSEFNDDLILPMQFTGLLDKNGKEIYDGDIFSQGEMVAGIMIFHEGCFKVDSWSKSQMPTCVNQDRARHWEVIGNKFEHKELLKNVK